MEYNELIDKWLIATPATESADLVKKLLVHYFGEECVKSKAASSHQLRIKDTRLANLPAFAPFGYLSVPISGGQRVKKPYLKLIASAIKYIKELEA